MIEMTPAAREHLDNYLQRIRSELRGSRSVVADDVEQSVREHVEIALADAPAPVGATQIITVLDRLGPPERWLGDEEGETSPAPRDEPEGQTLVWRLAYVSFAVLLVAALLPGFLFFLLIPAMVLSRATVELAQDRGVPLGGRRWLVYPSIAVVLALAVGVLLLLPPLSAMAGLSPEILRSFDIPGNAREQFRLNLGLRCVIFGGWWIIAAAFFAALLRPIRFMFAPLLQDLHRKHLAVLALLGALMAAGGATLIYSG